MNLRNNPGCPSLAAPLQLLLFILCVGTSPAVGMSGGSFRQLDLEYGVLKAERLDDIHITEYGVAWLATSASGLVRYDGQAAYRYKLSPDDLQSISNNNARVIFEDSKNRIWVGTLSGLNRFDRRTGGFKQFLSDPKDPTSLSYENIWAIGEDQQERIWVGGPEGLERLNPDGTRDEAFQFNYDGGILTICADTQNRIWVGGKWLGLGYFDLDDDTFYRLGEFEQAYIRDLKLDEKGHLWIASYSSGLMEIDLAGQIHCHEDLSNPQTNSINTLEVTPDNTIWTGSQIGLNKFDPDTKTWTHFPSSSEGDGPRSNFVTALAYYDDLIWIATNSGGIDTYDLRKHRFKNYNYADRSGARTVHRDQQGRIWIGSSFGFAQLLPNGTLGTSYLPTELIRGMTNISSGGMLVFTDRSIHQYPADMDPNKAKRLFYRQRVWSTQSTGPQSWWMGTENGILHYDLDDGVTEEYKPNRKKGEKPSVNHPIVTSLAMNQTGKLFIGTYGGGLNILDLGDQTFEYFTRNSDNPQSISANDITQLHSDQKGRIWITTTSGGLNLYQQDTQIFKRYSSKEGFPEDTLVNIQEDKRGNLWVVGLDGIIRFDPETEESIYLRSDDGVYMGGGYPTAGAYIQETDTLLFGGSNGLIEFTANSIKPPSHSSIVFTRLRKNRKEMYYPGEIIELNPNDRTLNIEASIIDYRTFTNTSMQYLRQDLDESWVEGEGGKITASYTSYLNYGGEGVLKLKGRNRNGIETKAELYFTSPTPLWLRFIPVIALLAFALLVWLIYTIIAAREREKRQVILRKAKIAESERELAEQRARVAEERNLIETKARKLQTERTRILQEHLEQVSTEIANDLHDGPLAALHGIGFRLNAMLQTSEDPTITETLQDLAGQQLPDVCSALRHHCGQLLLPEFQYGLVTELEAFADVVEALTPSLLIQRDLRDEEDLNISDEAQASVYRIYRTLLKNTVQHAKASEVNVHFHRNDKGLWLSVSDNGKGFDVPHDWEVFRREKHYGMYMANYFAESLGGYMKVRSQPDQGTDIEVFIPIALTGEVSYQDLASQLA